MPSRMIRDGILESEAVLSLPVEARWLYVSVLLSADDVGLFDATPFRLARRADLRREMADRLVQMLVDVDLIRLYEVSGKRYGFIPKFGQRLQLRRMRHPAPPLALMSGDDDAVKKIKDLASKSTVNHGASPINSSDSPPESEAEAEEVIPSLPSSEKVAKDACASVATSECPHVEIVKLFGQHLPMATHPSAWNAQRQALLRSRWREKKNRQNLEWWGRFFAYVAESDFLTGKANSHGRKPFTLDLPWLLKAENFLKVIEGKYHSHEEQA